MNLDQKHFERSAQHHALSAKRHRGIANAATKSMRKAAKSDLKDVDVESLTEFLDEFIQTHNALADEHTEMATHCEKCAKAAADDAEKAAEKAAKDRELSKRDDLEPLPQGFTRVPTAFPRAGQPVVEKANVPEEFKALVAVEHTEEFSLRK